MTAQEQTQIRELKSEIKAVRAENKDFRNEVRNDILVIKNLLEQIPKEYIPQKWAANTARAAKWVIATAIAILALIGWHNK